MSRGVKQSDYSCELLLEKTTIEQANDSSFPNDAYLIWYEIDGETFIDLCRGKRTNIFDFYYDRFGPGVVQKIDFGYGRTNPRLWKEKTKSEKKKK